MGLLNIIKKIRKNDKEVRILVLGLDNSGKTTILKALSNEDITQITPTKGFNIKNLSHDGFKLNVWDVGGQEVLRKYWNNYFENTNALVYVIDSSDTKRIPESGAELQKLLEEDELAGIPLLIYANKQDLLQALPPEEIRYVTINFPEFYYQILKISEKLKLVNIKDRQWSIVACSAKTQEGLTEGMEWLVSQIKK